MWHLTSHFFQDITHFDGKFFSSLQYLIFKPGFLSKEYVNGRRASYLNPIRMYVFTSAVFFLIFFSANKFEDKKINDAFVISSNGKTMKEILSMDSIELAKFTSNINKNDGKPAKPMTREEVTRYMDSAAEEVALNLVGKTYSTQKEYDSLQAKVLEKDSWLKRNIINKKLEINKKYNNTGSQLFTVLLVNLLHRLPQMMFVSLPLLALLLRLLYVRHKELYFVSHAIFCIHVYIFSFIAILCVIAFNKLLAVSNWGIFSFLSAAMIVGIFFYMYKAMRNFYEQSRAKTILKFFIFNLLNFFLLALLFIAFLLLSIFSI